MFDINKYLGKWYELAHDPYWFQRNVNYNTTAEYSLCDNGLKVINSTIVNGKSVQSEGFARQLHDAHFRVDFPMPEISKLEQTGEFKPPLINKDPNYANYVVDYIWTDQCQYIFAIVTDEKHESLYVLSRYAHPSLCAYNQVMQYVIEHYNRDLLVQTSHFD